MPEQPSEIARETKHLHQGLKDLLKKNEPWGRDVEYQRKQLRRRYLQLLLCHPYAKESQDAENHLWMQTSYSFISAYKQQVSALDKIVVNSSRQQLSKGGHGPVEQRKLLNRFKQFLAEEEKFWTDLVERIYRSFELTEAKAALVALEIIPATEETAPGSDSAQCVNGRNQNVAPFPVEESIAGIAPQNALQRESRLAILSKALIRLGDLARYRELYNESGGRPKAGQEDGARRHGRARRGGAPARMETLARPRNYEESQACYQQSKNLQPDDGNPSHQLAILASYQKDTFSSLVHYYRSLCVLRPAEMASENMATALAKFMDAWRTKKSEGDANEGSDKRSLPAPIRIEILKDTTIALHASWRLGNDSATAEPELAQTVFDDFSALVSERHLPPDIIAPFVLLSQGALYQHKNPTKSSRDARSSFSSEVLEALEHKKLYHLLNIHQALLETGSSELEEPLPKDVVESDPAQRITATFRRTLPALRIASRWLRANIEYVMQTHVHVPALPTDPRVITDFWTVYARFCCLLARSFPLTELPQHVSPLEEDMELKGFLPLGQLHNAGKHSRIVANKPGAEQVHPNVEHLMRIRDLLADAQCIASLEKSPIASYDTLVSMEKGNGLEPASSARERAATIIQDQTSIAFLADIRNQRLVAAVSREEDAMTVSTDDPVRDAFRKVLDGSDLDSSESHEDDGDEIVWDLKGPASPALAATATPSVPQSTSPVTPQKAMPIGIGKPALSPSRQIAASFGYSPPGNLTHGTPTTAQDLLHNVMGGTTRRASDAFRPSPFDSKGIQPPQLLFGNSAVGMNQSGSSIWSTAGTSQWQQAEAGLAPHASALSAMRPNDHLPMLTLPETSNPTAPWPSTFAPSSPNFPQHPTHASPMHSYAARPQPQQLQSARQRPPSMSIPQGYLEGTPRPPDLYPLNSVPSGYGQQPLQPHPFPGNPGLQSRPHPTLHSRGSMQMGRPDPAVIMHGLNHHNRHTSAVGQAGPGVFNGQHTAPLPYSHWGGHG